MKIGRKKKRGAAHLTTMNIPVVMEMIDVIAKGKMEMQKRKLLSGFLKCNPLNLKFL
jgi:hypothetical protein